VAFDIDANGILNVHAKDKGTGKEQKITITDSTGLKDEEIENMVKDAEANAEADKERREAIELKNQLDSLVYNTEKTLKDNKDKFSEEAIKSAEEALEEAKKAVETGESGPIKEQIEKLTQVSHQLAQTMYAQADKGADDAGATGEGAGGEGTSGDGDKKKSDEEDVVDAEFEDINKK
ncbi:MAG: Hsp70 family protein, partial [Nitrospinales bacterium]